MKREFTDAERAEMFAKARNANMVTLAYFSQDIRNASVDLAKIVSTASDLVDAQTIVDTIATALDELTHQYQSAMRKRDTFQNMERQA